jgi:hypothetical protein
VFAFAVIFVLAAVALTTRAQDPVTERDPTKDKKGRPTAEAKAADAMAEEIEIMRRLLEKTLGGLQHAATTTAPPVNPFPYNQYGPYSGPITTFQTGSSMPGGWGYPQGPTPQTSTYYPQNYWNPYNTAIPYTPGTATPERRGPEGVYLKGYGIVYTATIMLPTAPPVADAPTSAPKTLSDWDRTRLELRGEKAEAPKPHAAKDTIADAVLKVLATNGKHFSQLGENEQVTVALTLPRHQACTACHGEKGKTGGGTSSGTSGSSPGGTSTGSSTSEPLTKEEQETRNKIKAAKADAEKQILLGELHLKQNKWDQAAAAFEEALKHLSVVQELVQRYGVNPRESQDFRVTADATATVGKLLQAYAALGKTDQADKTLHLLDKYRETVSVEAPVKAHEPAKGELPGKLVITAPKKLLDLAGSGKVTFEEFKKAATVEYQPDKTVEKSK